MPPIALLEKYPASEHAATLVKQTRHEAHNIIHGKDDRLLVIIGLALFMILKLRLSMQTV